MGLHGKDAIYATLTNVANALPALDLMTRFYLSQAALFIMGAIFGVLSAYVIRTVGAHTQRSKRSRESGNVMLMLFGTIAMAGVVGASSMQIMKGPVRSMHNVTQRTIAENSMIASGKLALMGAVNQADGGDCDGDQAIEPVMFEDAAALPHPAGGGFLPADIGASLQDPWQSRYGYCVWDHGSVVLDPACDVSGVHNRLAGGTDDGKHVLAVISAGPDRVFQTSCAAYDAGTPDAPLLVKVAGSDDIVYGYTYGEARTASGGLWNIKGGEPTTAEIGQRDIEVAGSSGTDTAKIGYDSDLGFGGVGKFMAIKSDAVYANTPDAPVEFESILRLKMVSGLSAPVSGGGGGGTDTLASLSCSPNQVPKWDRTAWVCSAQAADNLGNHTATQALAMGGFKITNAADPTAAQDVATKAYVDANASGGSSVNVQLFSTPGTATWTKPASKTMVFVECWAGGGGGQRSTSNAYGGGGGGYRQAILPASILPASVTVTVGAGGTGKTGSNGSGGNGGDSSFGSYVGAQGGRGGATQGVSWSGTDGGGGGGFVSLCTSGAYREEGAGGSGYGYPTLQAASGNACSADGDCSNCSCHLCKASTATSENVTYGGGGGGGYVGSARAGGTSSIGGTGGNGNASGTAGSPGAVPGGGGAGGRNADGGNGGRGECRVVSW